MKILPEIKALELLDEVRTKYAAVIRSEYEHRAKSCETCTTPGACCLDAHFVNVHITPLEAVAIKKALDRLPDERRREVDARITDAVTRYGLADTGDTFSRTFSCPLFEKGTGCLVHDMAKPLPCIQHACYENAADLPLDTLQTAAEHEVERLNQRTYGRPRPWQPLPVALSEADLLIFPPSIVIGISKTRNMT